MHYARRSSFNAANALMQQALNGATDTVDWSIETSLYHLLTSHRNGDSCSHSSNKSDRLSLPFLSFTTSSLSPSEAEDGWRFLSRFVIYFIKGCFVGIDSN